MKTWLLLLAAILTEVTASVSLKAAQTHPIWYPLVVLGYVASFYLLSRVLRLGLGLGVAYGIWGATGVALTALASVLFFGEPLTPLMIGGLILIIAGVLVVELGSQRAHGAAERAAAAPASAAATAVAATTTAAAATTSAEAPTEAPA
ncbi:QacE family quaternary ammonium compound efflux SMR transporter [Mycetocola lacteus]|uniref:QacE family quaternary ammonium compound efflux SMR transporter n=1 Tax=Mycetocola lacteus TaxID=76637 RepID=A0A3L7AQI5_9MICO|nr:multidrug efflux SMR transporter [Mycetocola lacteus]RLP82384.1 QacE family quaternary ammonium compound efflux SMR transporter [Mycetocola lacteus]